MDKNCNIKTENLIIARYGEIHLKGDNRGFFLRALKQNLIKAIGQLARVSIENSRILITDFNAAESEQIINIAASTFGIVNVSPAVKIESSPQNILNYVKTLEISGTFKVEVNRADKNFPYKSPQFAAQAGEVILNTNTDAKVDVISPQTVVSIDIRESSFGAANNNDSNISDPARQKTGYAFVFNKTIKGAGGMPVGTAGRALVMLSGGIDSPVAAYLAAKRGLSIECVHFFSPPYTSEFALEKVKNLTEKLEPFCGKIKLHIIPFTEIQEAIRAKCNGEYMITLMRRFMVRIAENLALQHGIDCIITGENLSQVASQTVQGIMSNNICARVLPILRPLVTFDKYEIIEIARKIDTYDISCKPYPDCCTVFVPRHPSIKPNLKKLEIEEQKLDVEGLIKNCLNDISH